MSHRHAHLYALANLLLVVVSSIAVVTAFGESSIEIGVYVDKSALDGWKHEHTNPASSDAERKEDAQSQIRQFVTSAFVSLNKVLLPVHIDARLEDVRFPATAIFTGQDMDDVLSAFLTFVDGQSNRTADFHMLLVGFSQAELLNINPLTYTGSACGADSVAVLPFNRHQGLLLQMARTLGHSLGASLDGDGNACSAAAGMIMSHSETSFTPNMYRFSTCSKAAVAKYVSGQSGACLRPTNTTVGRVSGDPLGKTYSPDSICKLNFGNDSSATGMKSGSVCLQQVCAVGEANKTIPVADGTTCGDHKVCSLGSCIESPEITHSIEIGVFVDQDAYFDWQAQFVDSSLSPEDKDRETQRQMEEYVTSLFVSINNIMKQIHVDVRITNFFYQKKIMYYPGIDPGSLVIHFLHQAEPQSDADVNLLLTTLNQRVDETPKPVIGSSSGRHAIVGAIRFGGALVFQLTRVFGSLVGARYDVDFPKCSFAMAYVMAYFPVEIWSPRAYRFSPCSLTTVQSFLKSSAADKYLPSNTKASKVEGVLLGSLYNASRMCDMAWGGPAQVLASDFEHPHKSPCFKLYCSRKGGFYVDKILLGADGFECAPNKVCNLGSCVAQ